MSDASNQCLQNSTKVFGKYPTKTRNSRIVFTVGGKGGVGKTCLASSLASWYDSNGIPVQLLCMDSENKERGSLSHFFQGRATKVNIHTLAGLDAFVDFISNGPPIVLADQGAGSGHVSATWFDKMHKYAGESGIRFTAIGLVTEDPASVASILNWANTLQRRVDWLVVLNYTSPQADFRYWQNSVEAKEFVAIFDPITIEMPFILPDLEGLARNYGVTLASIARRETDVTELRRAALVMRALSHNSFMKGQFDLAKSILLPVEDGEQP